MNHAHRMARRNEHIRTGTWWKFHCETGAFYFGCNVGPFMGRHYYKGPTVFQHPETGSEILPVLPQRV